MISAFVVNLGIWFGKWHRPDTWITGNIVALNSIPEIAAKFYFLYALYTEKNTGTLKIDV